MCIYSSLFKTAKDQIKILFGYSNSCIINLEFYPILFIATDGEQLKGRKIEETLKKVRIEQEIRRKNKKPSKWR